MGQSIRAVPAQRSIGDLTTANLRAEIARAGLTGAGFGRMMEWSKNTTTRKLTGRSALTVNELDRAATVLGISVAILLAGAA